MNRQFSLIIPSWNNLAYLQNCIRSIRKNSVFQHQIIVHVNEGSDGTLEWVQAQEDIEFTHSSENIGICCALNNSRQLLKTDYLVYINDDMYLCPEWDKHLYDEIAGLPDNLFFLSGTLIEAGGDNDCIIHHDFGSSLNDFDEKRLLEEYRTLPFHDWNGATWPFNIVSRELWDMVGGYSIEFSPGLYSDPDFSRKLWEIGVRYFKGVSASRAYHLPRQSTGRLKEIDKQGRTQFMFKWGISSNYFTKNYLQMGTPCQGPLPEHHIRFPLLQKIKTLFYMVMR